MLKLKKLQILGFKSFCDRTELKFHGEGVAAIIGPNGCGKSNIADAISWVLGEQSAKTLRGSRMEDVIFAGTRDRKPTGMAEVSLTLIDPAEYSGPDKNDPTELVLQEEMPAEDWDEAEIRAKAAEEVERITEENQPGATEEVEIPRSKIKMVAMAFPDDEPMFAANVVPFVAPASASAPMKSTSVVSAETGGAQVVLKIRRRKFQQQFHSGEIVVTRRLFRSGDSEYLLNGKLCRLRDIQELFMGTGLGPESYALIEQGRIGQILSSRPTDRRAIIEEAAGITKFKTKKRLAEARLEDAKLNLARVNDIFEEVTRQMNSLKRQASKAERYGRLRDEMRAKLRLVVASKFAYFDLQGAELDSAINTVSEEMRHQTDGLREMETELAERTQRGYAIEAEIRENGGRLADLKLEVDRNQSQRRHNEERGNELTIRAAAFDTELGQARARLTTLEEELNSNRQSLESAAADLAAAHQELEASQQQAISAAGALAELEHQQEQSRVAILESVAASSNLRNQLTQAEERMAAADREAQRLQAEIAAASSQSETFGGERGQIAIEFESVSQRIAALTTEITQTRDLLESKRRQEAESKKHLDSLRAEFATALGKRSSLEAVIAEHGYSTESVRRLFQSGVFQGGKAPVGVLADFLEVDPRYEGVVEDFLRDELNYIVVKSWDAANEGLRLLRSDVDGRATFLVHPDDSQARFSFAVADGAPNPPNESILPLKHMIRVLDGFGKSLEVILPKLRDGYIVPDPAFARDLALENPDAFFLSKSGECFHNVTVTGGKQRAEGPLSMKRELRDVMRLEGDLEQALRHEETRALNLGHEIAELTSLLEKLEADKRESEKHAMTSGHALRQMDSEMARVRERWAVCERELARLSAERAAQEEVVGARRTEIAEIETRRATLEQEAAAANEMMVSLRENRDLAAQAVSERKAPRRRSKSGIALQLRSWSELRNWSPRCRRGWNRLGRKSKLRLQRKLSASWKTSRSRRSWLISKLNATPAKSAPGCCNSNPSRRGRGWLNWTRCCATPAECWMHRAIAKPSFLLRWSSCNPTREYLAQTCVNDLGVQRVELMADTTLPRVSGDELAAEEQACQEMRARLDAMGPVNMMALEEFKETAERQAFLDTQRKDLLDAIENTTATIKEIDTFSRQKFEEAFNKINENFQVTFKKLFGGGNAFMRLTDLENSNSRKAALT